MSLYVRVFACATHGDLLAEPWDGGYLHDFDATRYKCAVDPQSCYLGLICAVKLHSGGPWLVSTDPECDEWTHIDDPKWRGKYHEQNDVDLQLMRSQLEALRADAHPCVVCRDRMLARSDADVCFNCWKASII